MEKRCTEATSCSVQGRYTDPQADIFIEKLENRNRVWKVTCPRQDWKAKEGNNYLVSFGNQEYPTCSPNENGIVARDFSEAERR